MDQRSGLSGDQVALALVPVLDVKRLAEFVRRIVSERCENDVSDAAEIFCIFGSNFRELLSDIFKGLPIASAFPRALNGFNERMDEAVHIRRVDIVLFVEGGGRKHDIGVDRSRAHSEVHVDEKIQLALRCGAPLFQERHEFFVRTVQFSA